MASGLVESNWPNFIKIGPDSSKAFFSLLPLSSFEEYNFHGEIRKNSFSA